MNRNLSTKSLFSHVSFALLAALAPFAYEGTAEAQKPSNGSLPVMAQTDDQGFLESMATHQQVSLDMAQAALNRTRRQEIRGLAETVRSEKNREMASMKDWYRLWFGGDLGQVTGARLNSEQGKNNGKTTASRTCTQPSSTQATKDEILQKQIMCFTAFDVSNRMQALNTAADFDQVYLQQMIPHEKWGIILATLALDSGRENLRSFSKQFIQNSEDRIEEMRNWYQQWYR